jgi:hypothetical protein
LFDDAGHWLLETHLDEAVRLSRQFLGRVFPAETRVSEPFLLRP